MNRLLVSAALILALVTVLSCAKKPGEKIVFLKEGHSNLYQNLQEELTKPRGKSIFPSKIEDGFELSNPDTKKKKVVHNCREFLNAREEGYLAWTTYQKQAGRHFAKCDLLKLYGDAKPAKKSFIAKSNLSFDLYKTWDLKNSRLSMVSAGKYELAGKYIKDHYDEGEVKIKDNVLIIDTPDWRYGFNIVAFSDFNGDGREDVLLNILDDANVGTYHARYYLVITRLSETADYSTAMGLGLETGIRQY